MMFLEVPYEQSTTEKHLDLSGNRLLLVSLALGGLCSAAGRIRAGDEAQSELGNGGIFRSHVPDVPDALLCLK